METISSLNGLTKESPPKEKGVKDKNLHKIHKQKGSVNEKLNKAAPFNFFLTGIKFCRETLQEDLSITFPELLDRSLGGIEHSLHLNFMVDFPWLLEQYEISMCRNPSLTVLYDCGITPNRLGNHINLTAIKVKSPYPFGHHHTKLSIFFYNDKSVRFSVYTANLIESDWDDRVQGVWISPKCPYLGDDVPINYGESETLFKVDIIKYLNSYRLEELRDLIVRIQKCDCSSIKVCFVASTPGLHKDSFGILKLSKLIKEHSLQRDMSSWQLVAQCSSIGSLGPSPESWLFGEFGRNLRENVGPSTQPISVIYPSFENVKQSIYGMWGGACLPYSSNVHKKQLWLEKYLFQWKCDGRNRSRVVPHIKSYCKISDDGQKLAWFLVTSANLSKAAWGKCNNAGQARMMSYEAGVLFFPKFLIGKEVFEVKRGGYSSAVNKEEFPLPYDSPLTSYNIKDKIFLYDKHFPR